MAHPALSFTNPAFPHGLRGYRRGCKCRKCLREYASYQRKWRADHASDDAPDNVSQLRGRGSPGETNGSPPAHVPGPNELAFLKDVEGFSEDVPGKFSMIEQAKTMCRVLDNPKESSQHATVSRQLMAIVTVLSGTNAAGKARKKKSGGRLATVGNLTKHRRASA